MELIKNCLHAKVQGGCSGRLPWLRGGEGCGFSIAAMRNIQVLVTPQQPIKLSQASSPTKLAPIIAVTGTEVSLHCPGAKAGVDTKRFGTAAAADLAVAGIMIRMGSTIASFCVLVGFSWRLAAPSAIRNVL